MHGKAVSHSVCRLGLHTVVPPPSQPWERRASLSEAMGLGLRNATCTLSSELQSGDAWSFYFKIAQRRRGGWLRPGRRDPGRRRRLGGCLKTRETQRCAVRAGFGTALSQGKARAQTQTTQGSDFNRLHRLYMQSYSYMYSSLT